MQTPREAGFAPPPLTRWGRVWRILAALTAGAFSWFGTADFVPEGREGILIVDLVLGLAAIAVMTQRRRWPVLVAAITVVLTTFSGFAVGAAGISLISMATRRQWREVLGIGGLWFASGIISANVYPPAQAELDTGLWWLGLLFSALIIAICVAIGFYIGARRELVASLQARAEISEREQAAREEQARATERSRIAREMHDVLAHRISLVAMHSGALAYRTDLTPAETSEVAGTIRDNAHLALTELREVLGVLRSDQGLDHDTRPQPTLAAMSELVEQTASAGSAVEVDTAPRVAAALGGLPESVSRTAYRILQEALTNARKHAPGVPVRVRVAGTPGERLTLEVRNAAVGPRDRAQDLPTSGMGLAGLRERTAIAGGELTHSLDRAGDFVLRAWLPWPT